MHAARGRIMLQQAGGQTRAARFGRITVQTRSGPLQSRLGGSGSFWFDELAPGRHQDVVRAEGGDARCTPAAPANDAKGIAALGAVVCTMRSARRSVGEERVRTVRS